MTIDNVSSFLQLFHFDFSNLVLLSYSHAHAVDVGVAYCCYFSHKNGELSLLSPGQLALIVEMFVAGCYKIGFNYGQSTQITLIISMISLTLLVSGK